MVTERGRRSIVGGVTDSLTIERLGDVAVLKLDDGKANALSKDLIAAIKAGVLSGGTDGGPKAVVIAGRDGVLSGGFDLGVMQSGDDAAVVDLVADGGDLIRTCYGADVPVVAACTGHGIAAGALLLLACDVRVGADLPDKKVGTPEVTIQMGLPQWAITIAQERLNPAHLQQALANGRLTDPATAVDVGFLDEVVPADQVVDRAVELATGLAENVHLPSYKSIVSGLRGPVLAALDQQVAADRASGSAV